MLRREAAGGVELVVGSRGHGGFAGMLLGSVGTHLAGQVPVPFVVVRPEVSAPHELIVAGADGSAEAEAALTYAFEEARSRGCRLLVLYAWQLPVHAYAPEISYGIDEVRRAQEEQTVPEREAPSRRRRNAHRPGRPAEPRSRHRAGDASAVAPGVGVVLLPLQPVDHVDDTVDSARQPGGRQSVAAPA